MPKRAGLIVGIAFVVVLGAPATALAAIALVSPSSGASVQARDTSPLTFTVTAPAGELMHIVASTSSATNSAGEISSGSAFLVRTDNGSPGTYTAQIDQASSNFMIKTPGTYYWQAYYTDNSSPPFSVDVVSAINTLTITPLPPPSSVSPSSGATIPYGGAMTFTLQEPPYYLDGSTRQYIDFATNTSQLPNGSFANGAAYQPGPVGSNNYTYTLGYPYTSNPGTWYWQTERLDCYAEPDCLVTNNAIRTFTVLPKPSTSTAPPSTAPAPVTSAPKKKRCHKHKKCKRR